MQKAHLALRSFKEPGFKHRRIGQPVRISENSGPPFALVPYLHQRNIYTKRKLREWRDEKCNPCFSAKSPPRSTDLQSTRFHASPYRAADTNLRKFRATFDHGAVFAPKQCLCQKEATGMESSKIKSLFQCKKPTSQYRPSNYQVFCIATYRSLYNFAEIRGYIWPWYRHCIKLTFISKGSYGKG